MIRRAPVTRPRPSGGLRLLAWRLRTVHPVPAYRFRVGEAVNVHGMFELPGMAPAVLQLNDLRVMYAPRSPLPLAHVRNGAGRSLGQLVLRRRPPRWWDRGTWLEVLEVPERVQP